MTPNGSKTSISPTNDAVHHPNVEIPAEFNRAVLEALEELAQNPQY